MIQKNLGQSDLIVSALGLGCMGMTGYYGELEDEQSTISTIHKAIDLGINLLDTADIYSHGYNEELVGKAIKGKRDKVVLSTKFGNVSGVDSSKVEVNGRPEYVKEACETSLRRLQVEHIDLYYLHRVDPNVPIEETVGAMSELVREGKVRYIGLSEASTQTIRRGHKVHPITALQSEYSLWSREVENEILPTCRELGIGFVAYSPLGRGFLTGSLKKTNDLPDGDRRKAFPRFQGEHFSRNLELVAKLEECALRKKCTPAQLALAWLFTQGDDIIPIPGTKKIKYLEENIGALNITLTPQEMKELEEIAPIGSASGERYPETLMRKVNL